MQQHWAESGAQAALVTANLLRHSPNSLIVILPRGGDVDDFCDDLAVFSATSPEKFPAWETAPGERDIDDEAHGDRLRVLKLLQANAPKLIVTSIQALLQPVQPPELLAKQTLRLRIGDETAPATLLRWLAENNFQNTTAVELPGEFSPRGGLVDVFAADWFHPVRIEFFGDTVESIRQFEVSTQRSLETLETIDITALASGSPSRDHFANYLSSNSWFLLVEPHEIQEEGRHYRQRLDRPQDVHDLDDALASIYKFPSVTAAAVASGSMEAECQLRIESVERFSGDIAKVRDELDTVGTGYDVHLICPTEAEIERLREVFGATKLAAAGRLHFPIGRLAVRLPDRQRKNRAGLQRRAVPPARFKPAIAPPIGPRDR